MLISITGAIQALSSSGKLELAGCGSGERNRQRETDTGYEADACFMALDVNEKYQSQIYRSLEHMELAQSL